MNVWMFKKRYWAPMLGAAVAWAGVCLPTATAHAEATPDFEAVDIAPPPPPPPPKPKPAPKPKVDPPASTTPAPAPKPKPTTPKPPPPPPPPPLIVDLELVMLVDVSASVDETEFALQRLGYVNAFKDPELHELIESRNGIAVNMIQWSGPKQQHGTGWKILRTADDCVDFADRVAGFERKYAQDTVLARALGSAWWSLKNNRQGSSKIVGKRLLIDVSGDGVCENQYFYATGIGGKYSDGTPMDGKYYGWSWDSVQNTLARDEIIVNGISIGDSPGLADWYASDVARGEFSFAMHAETFGAFGEAIKKKLLRELATPIPTTEIGTAYD